MVPADLFNSTCGAGTLCYYFGASDLGGWLAAFFFSRVPFFSGAPIFFFGSAGYNMRDLIFEISGALSLFFSEEYRPLTERVVNKTVAELGELTASLELCYCYRIHNAKQTLELSRGWD